MSLALMAVMAPLTATSARADSYGDYCPPSSGTISIGPGTANMCIHGNSHALTVVDAFRQNNTIVNHCAGAHGSYNVNGTHVIPYVCGIGAPTSGHVATAYYSSGVYGYPIHKNDATQTWGGFWGSFSFVTGTLRARVASGSVRARVAGRRVTAAVRSRFGTFRSAQQASDRLGDRLRGPMVRQFYADQTRVVPAEGAEERGARAETKVYVAGAPNNELCVLVVPAGASGPGGQCQPVDETALGRNYVEQVFSDADVEIAGLVPDGVTEVSVVLDNGSVDVLPVADNAYRGRFGAGIASINFAGAAGPVSVNLHA